MDNAAIGLIIIFGIIGMVIFILYGTEGFPNDSTSIGDIKNNLKTNIQNSLPVNADISSDEIGNYVAFFKPPNANLDQQHSTEPLSQQITSNKKSLEIVQTICAEQNSYYDPNIGEAGSCVSNRVLNSTSQITPEEVKPITSIDLDIKGITYSKTSSTTKIISSNESGGLPYVNRSEIVMVIGKISMVDPEHSPDTNGNPVYFPGPYYYHYEILGPSGEFKYAGKPGTKTDDNGIFELTWSTDLKDVLGMYTIKVEAKTSLDPPTRVINTIQFELR